MNKNILNSEVIHSSIDQLKQKLLLLKKELFNLRFHKKLGSLKNTSSFSIVKKSIARINTELTNRLKSKG
jgi:large subunit ribosomal protein L29